MGIFDKLMGGPVQGGTAQGGTATSAAQAPLSPREIFTFAALPESLEQMQTLPEATLDTPFKTAALTVCALCAYAANREIGTAMLNWLRGPCPLTGHDISFLNDRFRDNRSYIPFSYFKGAAPENDYTPSQPFTLTVESTANSVIEEGLVKLFIPCGGADSPRPITLRRKGDGTWCLWEQSLLVDVRMPASRDPWA